MWPDWATIVASYVICGTPVLCGAPCVPENTRGTSGSKLIGARVPGGKLGPGRSKGAAALVLCARSS